MLNAYKRFLFTKAIALSKSEGTFFLITEEKQRFLWFAVYEMANMESRDVLCMFVYISCDFGGMHTYAYKYTYE